MRICRFGVVGWGIWYLEGIEFFEYSIVVFSTGVML